MLELDGLQISRQPAGALRISTISSRLEARKVAVEEGLQIAREYPMAHPSAD